jgi:diaminopimelate decarboxylase
LAITAKVNYLMTLSHSDIRKLANQYHTPLYVFEESTIRARCREVKEAISYPNTTIRYACKALTLQAILKIIQDEGIWIDASSLNECKRAALAGYHANQIAYTGESASAAVFTELLSMGVEMNCSSLDQMRLLGRIAPGSKLSVRVNPGEGHGANNKVNTGGPSSKHGIYIDQLEGVLSIAQQYSLQINGIHTHIGSGTDLSHWLRIKDITLAIAKGFDDLDFVNLGGGLPVIYNPETDSPMPLKEWGARLTESFQQFSKEYGKQIQLQIEPGRYFVAECGTLLAEVQNLKETPSYTFALLNTGFNHNPRPAMYGSYHPLEVVARDERTQGPLRSYVVAGYLCESGDVFTRSEDGSLLPRMLPTMALGDIVAMGLVGAYSHPMKSDYNSMNMPASILVSPDGSARMIERRGTLEDVMRRELGNERP